MLSTTLTSLALALLAPFAAGLLHHAPRNLIIGGAEAPEGRYKYTVSIKDDDGTHFCGGTLISKSVVLTAAHCVAFEGNYTVAIGRHNLTNSDVGDDVSIAETVVHPSYDMWMSDNYDIALLFLSRPTTADVDLVNINANSTLPIVAAGVTYLGWGEIDSDMATVNISATLREVETHVISNEQCEASEGIVDGTDSTASYNGLITDNMLCTFSVDKDSCQKDSGGPLILRGNDSSTDIQVGVASWGISCASDVFPGVAARLSSVYHWIKETVCKKSYVESSVPSFECGKQTHIENLFTDGVGIVEGDQAKSVATNEQSQNTDADNMTEIEIDSPNLLMEGDESYSVDNQLIDPANTLEGKSSHSVATNGQSTSSGKTTHIELDLADDSLTTDTASTVKEDTTQSVATNDQSTNTGSIIQTEINILDDAPEGDRISSVACNEQPTAAAMGIVMFVLFASHMMMTPK